MLIVLKFFSRIKCGYVKILSRGGLTEPCEALANYICSVFSTLDYTKDFLLEKYSNKIKVCALIVLETFLTADNQFMCESHTECGIKCINSTVVSIFSIMNSLLRMVTLEKTKSKHLSSDSLMIFQIIYFCGVKFMEYILTTILSPGKTVGLKQFQDDEVFPKR